MVEQKICSFCGESIEPGTGRLFVRKDGVTFSFCSNKCFRNMMVLKRFPRDTQWTAQYRREKEVRLAAEAHADQAGSKKKVAKVRKVIKTPKSTAAQVPSEKKEGAKKPSPSSTDSEGSEKTEGVES